MFSLDEAARRIAQLAKDKDLRTRMGKEARETVRQKLLPTRCLQYPDILGSFETIYRLNYHA